MINLILRPIVPQKVLESTVLKTVSARPNLSILGIFPLEYSSIKEPSGTL